MDLLEVGKEARLLFEAGSCGARRRVPLKQLGKIVARWRLMPWHLNRVAFCVLGLRSPALVAPPATDSDPFPPPSVRC